MIQYDRVAIDQRTSKHATQQTVEQQTERDRIAHGVALSEELQIQFLQPEMKWCRCNYA